MTLNPSQLKCLAVFSVFAIIGFGPVSPGCLIGMYVVLKRPAWFLQLVEGIYRHQLDGKVASHHHSQRTRLKSFLSLLLLFLLDIAPVPVTPVIAFAIILSRPKWFYRTVKSIYGQQP
jgi:hypothetical protein